ncbi:hypothetical protein BDR22DRAFT_818152 [Usnea florida]
MVDYRRRSGRNSDLQGLQSSFLGSLVVLPLRERAGRTPKPHQWDRSLRVSRYCKHPRRSPWLISFGSAKDLRKGESSGEFHSSHSALTVIIPPSGGSARESRPRGNEHKDHQVARWLGVKEGNSLAWKRAISLRRFGPYDCLSGFSLIGRN